MNSMFFCPLALRGDPSWSASFLVSSLIALPGAFAACVAAGLSVYIMTKFGLPVSTTQAIVGAIVGWNLYTGSSTNIKVLLTILSTWILCPIITALIAMLFFMNKWDINSKTSSD